LYRLSADELRRMKLTTADAVFERDVAGAPPTKSTTSLATVGQPAAPRE
jgi:hypothetical protein